MTVGPATASEPKLTLALFDAEVPEAPTAPMVSVCRDSPVPVPSSEPDVEDGAPMASPMAQPAADVGVPTLNDQFSICLCVRG